MKMRKALPLRSHGLNNKLGYITVSSPGGGYECRVSILTINIQQIYADCLNTHTFTKDVLAQQLARHCQRNAAERAAWLWQYNMDLAPTL